MRSIRFMFVFHTTTTTAVRVTFFVTDSRIFVTVIIVVVKNTLGSELRIKTWTENRRYLQHNPEITRHRYSPESRG